MRIVKVSRDAFPEINLDDFKRQQKITRIYVKKDGKYVLEENPGLMDWSIDKKREVAQDLRDSAYISYLAIEEDRIIGFMSLVKELVAERMILDLIQVDRDFRGQGIGRLLWEKVVEEAHLNGARELYISACPSEETIHFYKAMGAEVTDNPIMAIAEDEPDDLQMVCRIG
ncbi:MAG: GNAT family N-acetyltransferase [Lachnospiraceae bacterium]|nr:GNAT family N-acetyltransferase [Lachnospiraceae bacterium]